jgi:hypothetical protein
LKSASRLVHFGSFPASAGDVVVRETLGTNPRQRRKRSRRLRRLAPLLLVDAGVNGNVGHVAGMDDEQA